MVEEYLSCYKKRTVLLRAQEKLCFASRLQSQEADEQLRNHVETEINLYNHLAYTCAHNNVYILNTRTQTPISVTAAHLIENLKSRVKQCVVTNTLLPDKSAQILNSSARQKLKVSIIIELKSVQFSCMKPFCLLPEKKIKA